MKMRGMLLFRCSYFHPMRARIQIIKEKVGAGGGVCRDLPCRGTQGGRRKRWRGEEWLGSMGILVSVMVMVGLVGCGGEKKKPSPPPPPPPGIDTPPPGVGTPPPPGAEPTPDQKPAAPTADQKPQEKPKRPEKVEDWKREDYFTAKAEGDPKLVDALRYFGQKFIGKSSAALMLEELIRVEHPPAPKPEEKTAPPRGPGGAPGTPPGAVPPGQIPPEGPGLSPGMPGMMGPGSQAKSIQLTQQALEMAVWALVLNNTKEAREIIGKILTGQIDTGMDRLATETALKALAALPTPEHEQMLLAALLTPEKLRPAPAKEKPSVSPGAPGGPMEPGGPGVQMPPGSPGYGPGYGYAPGAGEQVTAAWMQQVALDLVKNRGSAALREKLAQYLVDPKVPLQVVERLGGFLKEAHPANLRAQLLFLQAPDTTEETRRKLLEYFMKYSADSLALVLGVPTGSVSGGPGMATGMGPAWGPEMPGGAPAAPGGIPSWPSGSGELGPSGPGGYGPGSGPAGMPGTGAIQPDPDLPYRTAATVWGGEIHTFLTAALGKIDSLEEHGPVVVWSATVPTPGIRHQMYQVLKARWYDGPAGLQKAGFPAQWVCDPAMVVCLKQLPRAKALKSGTMPGTGSVGLGTAGYTAPAGKTLPPALREKQQKEQTEEEWLRMSGDLVLALCQRFQQAGLREIELARQQRRRPDFSSPIQDLPLQLHEPQLTPKPSYRVVLPGEVGKKISGVSLAPTLIHYVRLEHKEKPSKVIDAYKRQLKTRRIYESPQMIWLDALQPGRSEELLRSMDVIITRGQTGTRVGVGSPGGAPGRGPAGREKEVEEPLVIQILAIEMRDPSQDPTRPPQAAQTPKEKP